MSSLNHYDVIVIGTGAGGGTLAHRLAPSGKRILMLERGGFLARERENWDSRAVIVEGRYKTHEHWHESNGTRFQPGIHYYVGGQTKFYGAALLRMRAEDFGELRHHGGVSPAWPLGYDDFAPYYTEAEYLYQVHGERGVDPTEPKADKPYAFPAVSHEPRIQKLHDDFARIGLHPFHLPVGIKLDERAPRRSECIRCATCDGFPCLVNAKADAQTICVDPALAYPNVTLVTDALVRRLETDASGRTVTAVVVERAGAEERYTASLVAVSCGAVNSAALLLRSANDRHPDGLANRSGMVGRNYMSHNNSALLAISREPNPTRFQKTIAVNDFYFGSRDWEHPMGHISMVGKSDKEMLSAGAPPGTPKRVLDKMAKHSVDFWLTSEDLPDPDNRVTLNKKGEITLSYRANNEEAHKRLTGALKRMLHKIGCEDEHLLPQHLYLGKKIPLAGVAHQCGTLRFGCDPAASVLDTDCKAHDLDNLYVVDASFFPSSSAVNPALTIMANALRVGDHLLERLR